MKRRFRVIAALFLCAFIVTAAHCPMTGKSIYLGSRTAFNNYLETFVNYRDTLPQGAERNALNAEFQPKFEECAAALDLWGKAVGTDQEITKMRAFNALFDKLYLLLKEKGIVKPVS